MARPRLRSIIRYFRRFTALQADAQIDNFGTIAFHAECERPGVAPRTRTLSSRRSSRIATAMGTERFLTLTTGHSYGTFAKTSAAVGPASANIVNSGMIALQAIAHAEAGSDPSSSAAFSAQASPLSRARFSSRSGPTPKSSSTIRASFEIAIKASATGEENAGAFALGGLIFQNASAGGTFVNLQSHSQSAMGSAGNNLLGPATCQTRQ